MKAWFLSFLMFYVISVNAQIPQLVYDFQSGPNGSDPIYLTPFNGKLYLTADDGTNGRELWSYDGSSAPVMVYNLNPGLASSGMVAYNEKMAVMGGNLYFSANNGSTGNELFKYDGTNPPVLAYDFGPGNSTPRSLTVVGSKLYFSAFTGASGTELYSYDGTNPPTKFDINPGTASSNPASLIEFNGKLYFTATTAADGTELFVYDPATNAYNMVQDINPGAMSSLPGPVIKADGKLWFAATSPTFGHELYSYDGTAVTRVTDVATGLVSGLTSQGLGFLNGFVYFAGSVDGLTYQLYRYDPSTGNATLVYTINPGGTAYVEGFQEYAGKLYFSAYSSGSGYELWVTDGTTTTQVADLNPTGSSDPSNLTVWNNSLYLNANNGIHGFELFKLTDPAGIKNVSFNGTVRLYPNPTDDKTALEITLQERQVLTVRLTDVTGKDVWCTTSKCPSGTTTIELPLDRFATGAYFYHLSDESGISLASGKAIKH